MRIADLVVAAGAGYVSRWTTFHAFQLMESMQYAIRKKGFSFIEILSQCPVSFGKAAGMKDPVSNLKYLRDNSIHVDETRGMSEEELEGKFVVGRLVERHQSEFTDGLERMNRRAQAQVLAEIRTKEAVKLLAEIRTKEAVK